MLAILLVTACGDGTPEHPNVIFLVMDTTRGDRCSLNGYGRSTTPELEALAPESMVFKNAWSPAGWTGPAHASMFTGLTPDHHGFFRTSREYLQRGPNVLANRLRSTGYRTACFTNNAVISPAYGLAQGFDSYAGYYDLGALRYPSAYGTHGNALAFAREAHQDGRPFFLFINDMEPHFPYTPPREFAERFLRAGLDPEILESARSIDDAAWHKHNLGMLEISEPELEVLSDLYDAEIACLDAEIGRFVLALREAGILDDSLLIIGGDHGENLGEHGLVGHLFSLHRTIRYVPLMIRLPGGERGGESNRDLVRLEDVYPTILEVCGLRPPDGLDGISLLGDTTGRVAKAVQGSPAGFLRRMNHVYNWEFDPTLPSARIDAVFDGRRHRITYSDGREFLFDVIEDPEEMNSLIP